MRLVGPNDAREILVKSMWFVQAPKFILLFSEPSNVCKPISLTVLVGTGIDQDILDPVGVFRVIFADLFDPLASHSSV